MTIKHMFIARELILEHQAEHGTTKARALKELTRDFPFKTEFRTGYICSQTPQEHRRIIDLKERSSSLYIGLMTQRAIDYLRLYSEPESALREALDNMSHDTPTNELDALNDIADLIGETGNKTTAGGLTINDCIREANEGIAARQMIREIMGCSQH